jgi:hypothetical protein
LLVALARPDATFVAGFKAWLRLGYCVRKGEKAIRIVAPMPIAQRERANGEETGETKLLCQALVFERGARPRCRQGRWSGGGVAA